MHDRRTFLKLGALASLSAPRVFGSCSSDSTPGENDAADASVNKPIVVSTWSHGISANESAWQILDGGGRALDAVEAGVRVTESDPTAESVGYGGLPDRDGHVTLDASIMNERGDCGSVAFLQHIVHPISVARLVMEKTPHVMLVGGGALQFALENGFEREVLLTSESESEWRKWLKEQPQHERPQVDVNSHDTIGMLALDESGNLSGACTTSGTAWKLHGRVGDSPIIGAGLYVDNEVGGACATGWGEAVIRVVGSHLVVELMRHGHAPEEACRRAVERVIRKNPDWTQIQVGFLALDKKGRYGAYCIEPGFDYAVNDRSSGNRLIPSPSWL